MCRWKEATIGQMIRRLFTLAPAVLSMLLILCGGLANAQTGALSQPGVSGEQPSVMKKTGTTLTGNTNLVGTINPLGIKLLTGFDYQDSYRYSDEYNMVSAYRRGGGGLGLTPAYVQPSIHLEWMPSIFAILNLDFSGYYFFGANEGMLSFASASEPFGDDVRRAREGTEESGWAERIMLKPTLQGKIGDIVIRNQSDLARYWFHGNGPYFLELDYDILLKNNDFLFANRTQILKNFSRSAAKSTLAGAFFEIVHADAADLTSRRIGLLVYSEQGPQIRAFTMTHYFAQLGYYLSDPNRAHGFFFLAGVGGDFGLK